MRRDELFEVVEPPAYGLTRLRARLAARRARRWKTVVLVSAAAALAVVVVTPRPEVSPFERDARAALDALSGAGPALEARGTTGVVALPSSTAGVRLWRVMAIQAGPAP